MEDWRPKTYGEVLDYYRAALSRLEKIALDAKDPNCQTALNTIGSHFRSLFSNVKLIDEIQAMIARLRDAYPGWNGAALAVNEWLYFDRNGVDESYQRRLRGYYDELLPSDLIEQIHYYSSDWAANIHDSDTIYGREGDNDHHYGKNKIKELVDAAPSQAAYFFPLLDKFLENQTNSGAIALVHIARHVNEPEHLLRYLLDSMNADSEIVVISNLARNVIFLSHVFYRSDLKEGGLLP